MPADTEGFAILVSVGLALLVMGVAALIVGTVLMMPRVGHHWWEGLLPGYNFYVLFCEARCQVLLALYIVNAAFVYGFFIQPEPEIQELIWWPIIFGVLMFQWLALCLAQRMHLSWFWQVLSFLAPSFAFCLIGLLPVRVDPDYYPWAVRPFIHFEHAIWEHPWEYERYGRRRRREEDEGNELEEEREEKLEEPEGGLEDEREDAPEGEGAEFADGLDEGLEGDGSEFEDEAGAEAVGFDDETGDGRGEFDEGEYAEDEFEEYEEGDLEGGFEDDPEEESYEEKDYDGDDLGDTGVLYAAEGDDAAPSEFREAEASPFEGSENGNSEGETPTEGPVMSDYESPESTAPEPEDAASIPAEDRYDDEPAYRGADFDPTGDEAVEEADRHGRRDFARHVDRILDEEARLFDRSPRTSVDPHGKPDDDLSDLVESQIEGVYAEQLGMPEVTQAVDAEEAAYLEENATYARERILEETHDEPEADGYAGRHLAAAVRHMRQEGADDPDRPEPDRRSRNSSIDDRLPKID